MTNRPGQPNDNPAACGVWERAAMFGRAGRSGCIGWNSRSNHVRHVSFGEQVTPAAQMSDWLGKLGLAYDERYGAVAADLPAPVCAPEPKREPAPKPAAPAAPPAPRQTFDRATLIAARVMIRDARGSAEDLDAVAEILNDTFPAGWPANIETQFDAAWRRVA